MICVAINTPTGAIMKRPIMLWMTSRSRSSMVSAIFIAHGVWWGDTHKKISGYETNENQNIKVLLQKYKAKHWKKIHLTPVSPKWNKQFNKDLEKIVPANKQWMSKTGVEYFPAFVDLNPYNIFIYRRPEDVAKSLNDKRVDVQYRDALHAAKWRFKYMKQLQEQHGGVFVNTDEVIKGDFTSIRDAIEYCGLMFDEEATRGAII